MALRLVAHELGWSVVVAPPTVLKAFTTGKGSAPKEQVILATFKRWGYSATDNNEADAYALLQLGLEYVGERESSLGGTSGRPKLSKERAALLGKLDVLRAA